MKYFIAWVIAVIVSSVFLCWLASKNMTKTADGKPRLNYKQVAFDAIAFMITIAVFPLFLMAGFIMIAEMMMPLFRLKTEAPYVMSFLFIVTVHVALFYGLHYLSAISSEITFVKARERYEVEREKKLRKEYRDSLETDVDKLLAAWEVSDGDNPVEEIVPLRTLTAEDINAGAREADKIIEFPTEEAK